MAFAREDQNTSSAPGSAGDRMSRRRGANHNRIDEEHVMFNAMSNAIIVGVDGRAGGRDALALAAIINRSGAGTLLAVHAYPYDYFTRRADDTEMESIMHNGAMGTLDHELKLADVHAIPIAVPDGSPARALHLAAARARAALIVVGSAHRGPLGRVLAGDVTTGTLHGAPCPVLVAPAAYALRSGKLKTIGVGYDGSPESRAAVDLARDLATTVDAHLHIIAVVATSHPDGPFPGYRPDRAEHTRLRHEEATDRIEAIVAELGPGVSGDVLAGEPAHELAFEGKFVDLMVTGSRNYGPIRRLMVGSTSASLVRHAPCPVLVTTRTIDDEQPVDTGAAMAAVS
jgi:nucleotide-binding universal stress UspA family protein